MPEKLCLDEKLLRVNTSYYRRELDRPTRKFYDLLKKIDDSGLGLPSPEVSAVSDSIEKFFGTYKTFKETLTKNGFFDGNLGIKNDFIETYSLYAGATEGNFHLNKFSDESIEIFKGNSINLSQDNYFLIDDLISTYINVIRKKAKNSEDLIGLTKDYFDWVIEETLKELKKQRYSSLVEQSNKFHIQINDITINGFNFLEKIDTTAYKFNHTLEDIVGNKSVISSLKRAVHAVLKYDSQEKINVMNTELDGFQQRFTLWGMPGTGKTATVEAILNYAQDYAEKNNKLLIIKNISNEFKSEYYSKSSQNLKKILDMPSKGDAIYIFIADDIDTVFYSRSQTKESPQDKANLEVLMHFLSGVCSVNYGNYLFIATTNYPLEEDGALSSRLKECQIYVNGPETKDDYIKLFNIKLKNSIKKGYVAVKNWEDVGKLCVKYGLSGRVVNDISKTISSYIYDVNEPEGVSGKKPEEQLKILHNFYLKNKIDGDEIIRRINQYHNNDQLKQQQEWEREVHRIYNYGMQRKEALKRMKLGKR